MPRPKPGNPDATTLAEAASILGLTTSRVSALRSQILTSYGAGGKLFYFSEFNGSVTSKGTVIVTVGLTKDQANDQSAFRLVIN